MNYHDLILSLTITISIRYNDVLHSLTAAHTPSKYIFKLFHHFQMHFFLKNFVVFYVIFYVANA